MNKNNINETITLFYNTTKFNIIQRTLKAQSSLSIYKTNELN